MVNLHYKEFSVPEKPNKATFLFPLTTIGREQNKRRRFSMCFTCCQLLFWQARRIKNI